MIYIDGHKIDNGGDRSDVDNVNNVNENYHTLNKCLYSLYLFGNTEVGFIIQNLSCLLICFYTSFSVLYYEYYSDDVFILWNIFIFPIYLLCDFIFSRKEVILHHFFALFLLVFIIKFENKRLFLQEVIALAKIEFSSIFLTIRYIIEKYKFRDNAVCDVFYHINNMLFIITFYKYRVIDYYNLLISNTKLHFILYELYLSGGYWDSFLIILFYTGLFGLYSLNIYWFSLIVKKIYKLTVYPTLTILNNIKFNECILQYVFFLNICIYVYKKDICIVDITLLHLFGLIILSLSSYTYHNYKYTHRCNGKDVNILTDKEFQKAYIYDNVAINIKSYCSILTILLSKSNNPLLILCISFYHIILGVLQIYFLNHLKKNNLSLVCNPPNENFYKSLKIICGVSILDLIILLTYVDYVYKLKIYLFIMCSFVFIKIEPFYNFSYVFFHIGLLYETIFIIDIYLTHFYAHNDMS